MGDIGEPAEGVLPSKAEAGRVAVVPRRLTASADPRPGQDVLAHDPVLAGAVEVGLDWAGLSAQARVDEMSAHYAGIEQDRFFRIRRYQAMTGEKLVMACTTGAEVHLWTQARAGRDHDTEHEMAHRAVTELQAYFLMAAGHDLANITGRVLALDPDLRAGLLKRIGTAFAVGGTEFSDYVSLNNKSAKAMHTVAGTSRYATLKAIPAAVSLLAQDTQWTTMTGERHGEFHRERTPSHGSIVLPEQSWTMHEGEPTLYIGGPETSAAAENLALERTSACTAAVALLTARMKDFGAQVDAVLEEFCDARADTTRGGVRRSIRD